MRSLMDSLGVTSQKLIQFGRKTVENLCDEKGVLGVK